MHDRSGWRLLLPILAVALLAAMAVGWAGCGSTPAGVTVIKMQGVRFVPAEVTIKKGTKVRWVNEDKTAHTSTSDDFKVGEQNPPTAWNSEPLNPGDSWERTFDSTGDFPFHCMVHTYMKGKVTVTE